MPSVSPICRGERAADTHGSDFKRRLLAKKTRVVPGDRRETRDPFRNLIRKGSGMGPGSPLRSVRDDSLIEVET